MPAPEPPEPAAPTVPGQSYFGRNDYIEYIAGNAPVIFTAPHGGSLTPSEISARTCGTNTTDLNTRDLVRAMQAAYFSRTGRYPHVVINHLARSRLDANRERDEATCGDAESAIAWQEWHSFLAAARDAILRTHGKGWYMDMHGHGHPIARLELGYLLSDADLSLSDAALDAGAAYEDQASVRTMSEDDALSTFAALLRGPSSLGALYLAEGFPSVPSPADPSPNAAPYFNGGYNTERYGCSAGGRVCGVQIEANLTGVRDNSTSRERFAEATVRVLDTYLSTHWALDLTPPEPIALEAQVVGTPSAASVVLTWSGATGATLDVYRDGTKVAETPNDGLHTDSPGRRTGTLVYRLCQAGTTVCSANVTVPL